MSMRRWSWCVSGLALLAAACAGEQSDEDFLASSQALTQNGADISIKTSSDWGAGYCADVTLKNNSTSAITDWRVTLDMNGSTLSNLWNGTNSGTTGTVNVTPAAFNKTIAPGSSAAFGFCASSTTSAQRAILVSASITGGGGSATGGTTGSG